MSATLQQECYAALWSALFRSTHSLDRYAGQGELFSRDSEPPSQAPPPSDPVAAMSEPHVEPVPMPDWAKGRDPTPDEHVAWKLINAVASTKELGQLKRKLVRLIDSGATTLSDGLLAHLHGIKAAKLLSQQGGPATSSQDMRIDRILRTRNSEGRATARRR